MGRHTDPLEVDSTPAPIKKFLEVVQGPRSGWPTPNEDRSPIPGDYAYLKLWETISPPRYVLGVNTDDWTVDLIMGVGLALRGVKMDSYIYAPAPTNEAATPSPQVGDWADHISGLLDPRQVTDVSADGEEVRLLIKVVAGKVFKTGWMPSINYEFTAPKEATS